MTHYLQAVMTGALTGGLYGLFALGLTLTWGVLHLINLAHFSFAFLAAYITYQLAVSWALDPLSTIVLSAPLFFALAIGFQRCLRLLRLDSVRSLTCTFGVFIIFETLFKLIWTADYRRIPLEHNRYFANSLNIGPFAIPFIQLLASGIAVLTVIIVYMILYKTYFGKGLRAAIQDREIAIAFGVDPTRIELVVAGISGATAAMTGAFIAMMYTLHPASPEQWIGLIFSIVILGGIGNPAGALGAGVAIGTIEAVTQLVADPALARLVALLFLLLALLFRPNGLAQALTPEVEQ